MIIVATALTACGGDRDYSSPNDPGEEKPVSQYDPSSLTKTISAGQLEGTQSSYDTHAYKGIPFAAAPVDDFRWRAPQTVESWDGVRDASEFGAICPQLGTLWGDADPATFGQLIGSEDCLFLNVWRPDSSDADLPVFYWIHGGSNTRGSGSYDTYNGAHLANEINAVVVTINYRLGALGWFYNSTLFNDNAEDSSGNYGLLDMIQGLDWVNENIATFGGDNGNVTIAGNSAGCFGVWGLLQSPLADDLYHKALCSSGFPAAYPAELGQGYTDGVIDQLLIINGDATTPEEARTLRFSLGQTATAELLRTLSVETLAGTVSQSPSNFIDGHVLPSAGYSEVIAGAFNKVPMIIGSTKDEGSYILGVLAPLFTTKGGASDPALWELINSDPATLSATDIIDPAVYPVYEDTHQTYSYLWNLVTDNTVSHASTHNPDIYRYDFNWDDMPAPWVEVFSAFHTMDLPFLFGNFITDQENVHHFAWSEENRVSREALSTAFMQYLGQFMRTGNPSDSESETPWLAWNNNNPSLEDKRIRLDDVIEGSAEEFTQEEYLQQLEQLPDSIKGLIQAFSAFLPPQQ